MSAWDDDVGYWFEMFIQDTLSRFKEVEHQKHLKERADYDRCWVTGEEWTWDS